jgi:phosphoribosylamine--glycine ligase
MAKPLVGIVMGSDSDLQIMQEARRMLDMFGVPSEMTVASAHRSPARAHEYAATARKRGLKVIIAGAGAAAHLAGVMAAGTTLPVIGVPIDSSPLKGLDALLSTAQMPGGIPVAAMAIGKAGAVNAGILAAEIIGAFDKSVEKKLTAHRAKMAADVDKKAKAVEAAR